MYEARQNKEKVNRVISSHIETIRTQCFRLKDNRIPIQMCPSRNKFTPNEDQLILTLHREMGYGWQDIAGQLNNRTARQVRERYIHFLDPDVQRKPWSKEEELLLMEKIEIFGRKWDKIAVFFENRTEASLRKKYYELCNGYYTGSEYDVQMEQTIGISDEDDLDENEKEDPDYSSTFRSLYGGFTQQTIQSMFPEYTKDCKYECCSCGKLFPRKRDRIGNEPYITIDHRNSVKRHWEKEGKLNQDKTVLNTWYNDTSNLQLMCSTHNSQKGG